MTLWHGVTDLYRTNPSYGRNAIVNARKLSRGTRPIPIMGVAERILYRALVSEIVSELVIAERTTDTYNQFILGPIRYVVLGEEADLSGTDAVEYIVEADIAAFYQYIDHEILRRELEIQTGKIAEIDALIRLLGETEGKVHGIPQALQPSAWLSELYAAIIERHLQRDGWAVWRYNDDFRIGCRDYTTALDAIEAIETAARTVGLVLADHKLATLKIDTYAIRHTGQPIETFADESDFEEIDILPGLYDDFVIGEPLGELVDLDWLSALDEASRENWFQETTPYILRRIVATLRQVADHGDDVLLEYADSLIIYMPSLMEEICNYLVELAASGKKERRQVLEKIDSILTSISISEWQSMWLINLLRSIEKDAFSPRRLDWIEDQRKRGHGRALAAEASLAQAEAGVAKLDTLMEAIKVQPDALVPWYLCAIAEFARREGSPRNQRISALRGVDRFHQIVLGS